MSDKPHIIKLERFFYTPETTIGKLYIDDIVFGFTLEDTARAWGIKVNKHTAIPANTINSLYNIKMTYSPKYKREMPLIYNTDELTLESGGISFDGLRFHGGNRHLDTEGCILIAANWDKDRSPGRISRSLSDELNERIKEMEKTCDVYLLVQNLKQMG